MAAASSVVRAERDGDLIGADYSLVEKNALYRCLDKLLEHQRRTVSSFAAALAGSVRRFLRRAPL